MEPWNKASQNPRPANCETLQYTPQNKDLLMFGMVFLQPSNPITPNFLIPFCTMHVKVHFKVINVTARRRTSKVSRCTRHPQRSTARPLKISRNSCLRTVNSAWVHSSMRINTQVPSKAANVTYGLLPNHSFPSGQLGILDHQQSKTKHTLSMQACSCAQKLVNTPLPDTSTQRAAEPRKQSLPHTKCTIASRCSQRASCTEKSRHPPTPEQTVPTPFFRREVLADG